MSNDSSTIIFKCLKLILKPVVKFCLQHSLGLKDLDTMVKSTFVEVASEQMTEQGEKVNVSKLNAMTGVDRRAIVAILNEKDTEISPSQYAARVIGQWRNDKKYLTKSGKPKVLSFGSDESEFNALVRTVTTSVHPKSILFDLVRAGSVEETSKGMRLVARSYRSKQNPVESFGFLSEDLEDLLMAVNDNVFTHEDELPNYHAASIFNNVAAKDVSKIRKWLHDQCATFQVKVERYLAQFDRDITDDDLKQDETGRRVSFGLYSRTDK